MTSLETLDDHAYIPAALAAAEPTWVTNLLTKLQHLDANVNALRFEVATLREGVHALHDEVTASLPKNVDTAATLSALTVEVARLRRRADELPVLLENSRAHPKAELYNPTTYKPSPETLLPEDGSWAEALVPPNPINRDELLGFTVDQCIACAANLNLPPLPPNTDVDIRRRQIALRLGVLVFS